MGLTFDYRIIIAYDGTRFNGWERQSQGERTVRGVLEDALTRLAGMQVSVVGSGRTDSGVHALGQVVSFRLERDWESESLGRALNALLPKDTLIRSVRRAPPGFHARFWAHRKTYFYQVTAGAFDDPFRSRYCHRLRRLPPVDRIRAATRLLVGTRDFSALRAAGSDVATSERTVYAIRVRGGRDWVRIFFTANGFLYKMVRNMTAFIMALAEERLGEDEARRILASGDRTRAPATYPGRGLFLWRVDHRDPGAGGRGKGRKPSPLGDE